jgi:hypothetical protein
MPRDAVRYNISRIAVMDNLKFLGLQQQKDLEKIDKLLLSLLQEKIVEVVKCRPTLCF